VSRTSTSGAWLTLDDAAKRTGFTRSWLLQQAAAGVPWAIDVGVKTKAFWRFNAEALADAVRAPNTRGDVVTSRLPADSVRQLLNVVSDQQATVKRRVQ
jgi:hypothetical protein